MCSVEQKDKSSIHDCNQGILDTKQQAKLILRSPETDNLVVVPKQGDKLLLTHEKIGVHNLYVHKKIMKMTHITKYIKLKKSLG